MTIVLNDVVSNNNTSVMNANFQKIEDAINDDLLKREVEQGEANEMRTPLDLNSNRAVNLVDGEDPQDAVTLSQAEDLVAAGPGGDTGGQVDSIVAGSNVTVDNTDPANPIIGSVVAPVTYNRIISGGVVWTGTGLVYESIGLEYELGGVVFTVADGTQITLTESDPSDDRIDTIFGNDEGEIDFITGMPAGVPVKTAVDETFQIELTFALVSALATEPDAPVTRTVYAENLQESGGEFDTSTSAPSRISLTSGASPINGVVGIKTVAPIAQGDTIDFIHTVDTSYSDFSYVQLKLKVLADWNSEYIVVRLQKTGTTVASFNLNNKVIDESNTTDVQTVTIFKSQFSAPIGSVFDGIQIFHRIKKGSDILYLMDDIIIHEDSSTNDEQQATVPEIIVESIVAGTNVTVDDTDTANPIVSATDTLPNKVDVSAFISGVPEDSAKLMTFVVNEGFDLPSGLTGSNAYVEVVPTAAATFTISKNGGGSLGTVNFALGANVATFTFTTLTSFSAGDRLQVVNQGTADATLADISMTFRGDL